MPVSTSRVRQVWTIPNLVTAVRLILTLPLAALVLSDPPGVIAAAGIALWAATDAVDGALARHLGQETEFGRWLDPLADRTGIAILMLALAWTGGLGWYVPGVVISVDIVVAVLSATAARRGELSVSRIGKLRSAVLFVALVGAALVNGGFDVLAAPTSVCAILGALLHAVAGADYVRSALRARPGN